MSISFDTTVAAIKVKVDSSDCVLCALVFSILISLYTSSTSILVLHNIVVFRLVYFVLMLLASILSCCSCASKILNFIDKKKENLGWIKNLLSNNR